LGYSKLLVVNWWGISAPANLPASTRATLLKNMGAVLTDQGFLESVKAKGFDPAVLLGDQFAQLISDDLRSWQLIAKQANISLDD
jgi:tripartite-type tricarboxylate transporter receptor subunit TctC